MDATDNTVGVGEYDGETGAQSGALQAADAGLGHDQDTARSLDIYAACAPRPHRAFMGWARSVGAALSIHVAADPGARRAYRQERQDRVRETQVSLIEDHLTAGDRAATHTAPRHVWLRRLAADALEAAAA